MFSSIGDAIFGKTVKHLDVHDMNEWNQLAVRVLSH